MDIEEPPCETARDLEEHLDEIIKDLQTAWEAEWQRRLLLAFFQHVTPWARENGVEPRSSLYRGMEIVWPDGELAAYFDIPTLEQQAEDQPTELEQLAYITEERIARAQIGSEAREIEGVLRRSQLTMPRAVRLVGEFLRGEEQKQEKKRLVGNPDDHKPEEEQP